MLGGFPWRPAVRHTPNRLSEPAHENSAHGRTPSGATRTHVLARVHPELRTFTPDATLTEIKSRCGLGSFEDVRTLGRRRQKRS